MTPSPDPATVSPAARAEEIGTLIDEHVRALVWFENDWKPANKKLVHDTRAALDAAVAELVRELDEARERLGGIEALIAAGRDPAPYVHTYTTGSGGPSHAK